MSASYPYPLGPHAQPNRAQQSYAQQTYIPQTVAHQPPAPVSWQPRWDATTNRSYFENTQTGRTAWDFLPGGYYRHESPSSSPAQQPQIKNTYNVYQAPAQSTQMPAQHHPQQHSQMLAAPQRPAHARSNSYSAYDGQNLARPAAAPQRASYGAYGQQAHSMKPGHAAHASYGHPQQHHQSQYAAALPAQTTHAFASHPQRVHGPQHMPGPTHALSASYSHPQNRQLHPHQQVRPSPSHASHPTTFKQSMPQKAPKARRPGKTAKSPKPHKIKAPKQPKQKTLKRPIQRDHNGRKIAAGAATGAVAGIAGYAVYEHYERYENETVVNTYWEEVVEYEEVEVVYVSESSDSDSDSDSDSNDNDRDNNDGVGYNDRDRWINDVQENARSDQGTGGWTAAGSGSGEAYGKTEMSYAPVPAQSGGTNSGDDGCWDCGSCFGCCCEDEKKGGDDCCDCGGCRSGCCCDGGEKDAKKDDGGCCVVM